MYIGLLLMCASIEGYMTEFNTLFLLVTYNEICIFLWMSSKEGEEVGEGKGAKLKRRGNIKRSVSVPTRIKDEVCSRKHRKI